MARWVKVAWKSLVDDLKESWTNTWYRWYVFILLLFVLSWTFTSWTKLLFLQVPVREITLSLLSFGMIMYAINNKVKKYESFFRFTDWFLAILFSLLTISYVFAQNKVLGVSVISLLIVFLLLLVAPLILHLHNLRHARKLRAIIISYFFVALLTVIIFSFVSAMIPGSKLVYTDSNIPQNETQVRNTWDQIHFSGTVFYASTFGDIMPIGPAKWVSLLELLASTILHVIVLSNILPSSCEDKKTR